MLGFVVGDLEDRGDLRIRGGAPAAGVRKPCRPPAPPPSLPRPEQTFPAMADEEVDVEAMLDESLKGPAPGEGGAGGEKRVREEEGSDAGEDKRRRERSRDRDRDKGRDRDRSRRDKSRSRSRSRSRRDRDRDRDRDRGRDRDRDRAKRDRRRDRRSPSPPLTAAERLKREQERELAELERDLRTVFVYQLHPKAPLKDIFKLFSQAGKVADIRIITDRYTGRSKGFGAQRPLRPVPRWRAASSFLRARAGYVEYADKMSILPALALNGQLLAGHPVLVKPSESEKNAAAQLAKVQAAMSAAPNPLESQLRISNVHKNVRVRDLEDIFSPFGRIEQLEIQEDAAGGDLGMAAVQFTNVDAARKAMQALNGLELAGATIVVTTAAPYSGASAVAAAATGAYQQTVDVGEIDDDGKTGLALNASARVRLEACL